MSKKAAESARRRSILCAALASVCTKEKKANRSLLKAGSETRVCARVDATVGRASIEYCVDGRLSVGHATTELKQAEGAKIVACLLAEFPDDESRARAIQRISSHFTKTKKLPEVAEPISTLTAAFLKLLKLSKPKAGVVSFSVSE